MTSRSRLQRPAAVLLAALLVTGPAWAEPTSGPTPRPPRATPVAPAAVAPVGGRLLRPFDPPATPYGRGHRGVDLGGVPGEPVRAALEGTVTFAGRVGGVTWVTLSHGGGLSTTYGGFAPSVHANDQVALGAPLGAVTDRARLDWGARRDGRYVDPLALLGGWRVALVPVP